MMKRSLLMLVILIGSNAHAIRRQETMSAAEENAARRAKIKALEAAKNLNTTQEEVPELTQELQNNPAAKQNNPNLPPPPPPFVDPNLPPAPAAPVKTTPQNNPNLPPPPPPFVDPNLPSAPGVPVAPNPKRPLPQPPKQRPVASEDIIKQGKKLNPAQERKLNQAPDRSTPHSKHMENIRKGVSLKATQHKKYVPEKSGLGKAMGEAMEARRKQLEGKSKNKTNDNNDGETTESDWN